MHNSCANKFAGNLWALQTNPSPAILNGLKWEEKYCEPVFLQCTYFRPNTHIFIIFYHICPWFFSRFPLENPPLSGTSLVYPGGCQVAIFQETVAAKALACVDHLLLRASQANLVAISLSPGAARWWPSGRTGEWGGRVANRIGMMLGVFGQFILQWWWHNSIVVMLYML